MDQLKVRVREALPKLLDEVSWQTDRFAGESEPGLDAEVGLSALLKILALNTYKPDIFQPAEQQFLRDWQLVVDSDQDGPTRSSSLEQDLGSRLFKLIFPDVHTERLFFGARRQSTGGLEIALELDPNATVAAQLPWELLWSDPDFLTVGAQGTLSRRFVYDGREANRTELEFDQLRALVISPRPQHPKLADLGDAELAALRQVPGLAVESLTPPTVDALSEYVDAHGGRQTPHIIHFDGHGIYGRACRTCKWVSPRLARECEQCGLKLDPTAKAEGFLAFESSSRAPELVSAENVALMLGPAVTDVDSQLRLVVLSACRSAAAIGAQSEFGGVAQRLISSSVPSVVAMQYAIEADAALSFSARLYTNLIEGRSVLDAVRRARTALKVRGTSQWYRPVVYLDLNGGEGHFFRRAETPSVQAPVKPPPNGEEAPPQDIYADVDLLEEAVSALADSISDARMAVSILPFRGSFLECEAELDKMGDYTDLHDVLHRLTFWYAALLPELELDGGPRPNRIRPYRNELTTHISSIQDILDRGNVSRNAVTWINDLQAAAATLRQIGETPQTPAPQLPLRRVGPLLAVVPERINALLEETAHGLPLGDLANALDSWRTVLTRNGANVSEQAHAAATGCEALRRVQATLNGMIDEHSRRQELDRYVGLDRQMLTDDAPSFTTQAWPELRGMLEPRWTSRLDTKVKAVLDERDRFDALVGSGHYDQLLDQFENCISAAGDYFHALDLQVQELCERLRRLGSGLIEVARHLTRHEAPEP